MVAGIVVVYLVGIVYGIDAENAGENTPSGLNQNAVPSLVLLGTAKGGTTDLWHIIHRLGIGFQQFENGTVGHIQTRKELDFFSGELCTSAADVCSAEHMRWLLRCPNAILSQYSLEGIYMVRVCQEWLEKRRIAAPTYTMTASPSLLYEYTIGSHALGGLATQTGAEPLYIILLRDPVQRMMSLYNHWYLQEKEHGYSLQLEELVQLELAFLALPRSQKLLEQVLSGCTSFKGSKGFKAAETLRQHMTIMLNGLGKFGEGRLNLRSFGLVLDGLYLPQIYNWLRSRPAMRRRLLIVKSEYLKANREACLRNTLLPFLFPMKPAQELDAIMTKATLPNMQNEKATKDPVSLLSPCTMKRLARFYKESKVEKFLLNLQERGTAKIVPPVREDQSWWPSYDQ